MIFITSNEAPDRVSRYPRAFAYVACLGMFLFTTPCTIGTDDWDSIHPGSVIFFEIVACCVIVAGIYLILLAANWKVELTDDFLIYRNLFRITKKYQYSEITKLSVKRVGGNIYEEVKIFIGKKKINVNYLTSNFFGFYTRLKLKIKKHKGKCEFEIKNKKK